MAIFAGERMSRADATWLHGDVSTNHFVVTTLAILDAPPDVSRLKTMLRYRIGLHAHLTDVIADDLAPLAPARWVPASNFDLDAHIHRVALPEPAGKAELAAFIGDLVGQPIDFGRPVWHVYAVEGPGKTGALVGRFHHTLGDGQAMVRLLLALTDQTADGWRRRPSHRRPHGNRRAADGRSPIARLIDNPPSIPGLLRSAVVGAGTVARLTLLDADPPTGLRGHLGLLKAVGWTDSIPLEDVKAIARLSGTTVNDVVVSAIAGGLGAHLRREGTDTRGLKVRAMVPVNLRPPDDESMKGNRFSLVFLELPVGIVDPYERLMRVKVEMDRIKRSMEPAAGWLLVQALGFLPTPAEHLASSFYGDKASLVLTNVIGPREPLYMAGSRIRQMTFWEPESGGLGVGVSIYSYAGQMTVGIVSDRNLVERPQRVADEVMRALADLGRAAKAEAEAR